MTDLNPDFINDQKMNEFNNQELEMKEKAQDNSPDNLNYPQMSPDIKNSNDNQNIEEDLIIQKQLRKGFIRKVYCILTSQLIFTFLMVLFCQIPSIKNFMQVNTTFMSLILGLFSIAFIIVFIILGCNPSVGKKVPYNYIILFTITLFESIFCSFLAAALDFKLVCFAILFTIGATAGLTFYAWTTKTDVTFMGGMLFMGLCQLFVFCIIALFIRSQILELLIILVTTFLFGIYIIYDTQLLIGKFGQYYQIDDYIFAAMQLYLDIIRLFIEIMKILAKFKQNK
jgi:FtsH-binding integral membrane protein